jgi:hypothetical protein
MMNAMVRFFRFSAAVTLWTLSVPAGAEELRNETWRGREVLRLTGLVEEGTAGRFAAALGQIKPFPHGLPVVLLDSPGGNVGEAFAMSRLMDLHPVHTVVPNGARCASACASIVFIAGTYRTVEPFGALGQHSCSVAGTPDQACNEELAQHALEHGVSHGSVAAFVTYVLPKDILWFSREDADGWGLTRYPEEQASGFEKSEPRAIKMITGKMPPAQSAWRIDFREDGYKAFVRTVSDAERELQLNLFCIESLRGRLFLSMEINGPSAIVSRAVLGLRVETDRFAWDDSEPFIWQADDQVSEVITEVPKSHIVGILSEVDRLKVMLAMTEGYEPIFAQTYLASSGKVLRFAANNCTSGHFTPGPPVQ